MQNQGPHIEAQNAKIAFVTCAYGADYAGFLLPHLYSLSKSHPEAVHLLLWQDIPEHEIELLGLLFPRLVITQTNEDLSSSSAQVLIPSKLKLWLQACDLYPHHRICFLDSDTVIHRPLHGVFNLAADAIFTWKEKGFPINVGVFIVASGLKGKTILTEWREKTQAILRSELDEACRESGAADQHALRRIIGFGPYEDFDKEIEIAGQNFRFTGVHCSKLNQTECAPLTDSTLVIHYKSGWHAILFKNAPFSINRPKEKCREMHDFFLSQYGHATQEKLSAFIESAALNSMPRFKEISRHVPYEERGILHSEMLCVVALCEALHVEVILESGRCRGQSTAMLAEYFAGTSVSVESAELIRDENSIFAEKRLEGRAVHLHYGDSFRVLPKRIKQLRGKRIALLIDGPKGEAAIELLRRSLHFSNDIAVAFIHDSRQGTIARQKISTTFKRAYFTDNPRYVELSQKLDEACLPQEGKITEHSWRPFFKGLDASESYGPTLGVIFPFAFEASTETLRHRLVIPHTVRMVARRILGIPFLQRLRNSLLKITS